MSNKIPYKQYKEEKAILTKNVATLLGPSYETPSGFWHEQGVMRHFLTAVYNTQSGEIRWPSEVQKDGEFSLIKLYPSKFTGKFIDIPLPIISGQETEQDRVTEVHRLLISFGFEYSQIKPVFSGLGEAVEFGTEPGDLVVRNSIALRNKFVAMVHSSSIEDLLKYDPPTTPIDFEVTCCKCKRDVEPSNNAVLYEAVLCALSKGISVPSTLWYEEGNFTDGYIPYVDKIWADVPVFDRGEIVPHDPQQTVQNVMDSWRTGQHLFPDEACEGSPSRRRNIEEGLWGNGKPMGELAPHAKQAYEFIKTLEAAPTK